MTREVDLVSYLPPFIAEYKETHTALTAENPEFQASWEAAGRVLKNEFIASADEYGIARFEKLLGILPHREDTLESRRMRVQSRWFSFTPYTWRVFLRRLAELCGERDFRVTPYFDYYRIDLQVSLGRFGQVEELEYLLRSMIPANMTMVTANAMQYEASGTVIVTAFLSEIRTFFLESGENPVYTPEGVLFLSANEGKIFHYEIGE